MFMFQYYTSLDLGPADRAAFPHHHRQVWGSLGIHFVMVIEIEFLINDGPEIVLKNKIK